MSLKYEPSSEQAGEVPGGLEGWGVSLVRRELAFVLRRAPRHSAQTERERERERKRERGSCLIEMARLRGTIEKGACLH